jgi:hypothetical protein
MRPEKPWLGDEGPGFDSRHLHHLGLARTPLTHSGVRVRLPYAYGHTLFADGFTYLVDTRLRLVNCGGRGGLVVLGAAGLVAIVPARQQRRPRGYARSAGATVARHKSARLAANNARERAAIRAPELYAAAPRWSYAELLAR